MANNLRFYFGRYVSRGLDIAGKMTAKRGAMLELMQRGVEEGECEFDEEANAFVPRGEFGELLIFH